MAEGGALSRGQSDNIVEKKPSAPLATILMIITTICLGLGIYICADEMNFYFRASDYDAEPQLRAPDYYQKFRSDVRKPSSLDRYEEEEEESP